MPNAVIISFPRRGSVEYHHRHPSVPLEHRDRPQPTVDYTQLTLTDQLCWVCLEQPIVNEDGMCAGCAG
jgi:hypothetical protein